MIERGSFYFAWVADGTPWSSALMREDENVLALTLDQSEDSEFGALSIDVRNPRIGLLNAGRNFWAWLAVETGSGATPLFFGRLIGVPQDLELEVVTLEFEARPTDYDALKADLAATLRVAPYWDPIWIAADRRTDPDAVLEARPQLWHVDPVTQAVSVTDLTAGEDGTLDLGTDFFYDSLGVRYGEPAVRAVSVTASVTWTQVASGSINLAPSLCAAARAAGTSVPNAITTLTGAGLSDDWPKVGDQIGGGWSVGASGVVRADGTSVPQGYVEQISTLQAVLLQVPVWTLRPTFTAAYDANRGFTETVSFTLNADVQALLSNAADQDTVALTLSSDGVDALVDPADSDNPGGTVPIGDVRRRSFLQTDRGHQAVEYLLTLARTQMLIRARAVEATFETTFWNGVGLTTRMNARIVDSRLPGGEATGKVIGVTLSADGDTGEMKAAVRIGCMIGQGNTVTDSAGTPDYAEDGYAEDGWQTRSGQLVMPLAGLVTYANYDGTPIGDDGLNFMDLRVADVLESATVIDGIGTQEALIHSFPFDFQAGLAALGQAFTEIDVKLVPIGAGPFETGYALTVSDLMIPKTIDLTAGSTA